MSLELIARTVQCPYCGEMLEILVDTSAGDMDYIEDCQVCCRPIEIGLRVDATGDLAGLIVHRDDA